MTEREAVLVIRKYVEEHKCTFKEYYGIRSGESKFESTANFCVCWNGDTVAKFFIHNSPIAPPDEIKWLKNLRLMSVNQIDGDLLWLQKIECLKRLDIIIRNDQLPEIWTCSTTLQELHLWYVGKQRYQTIPSSFRNFRQLRYLSISTSSFPIELPTWFHELVNLKRINLRNCHIKSIPYSLIQTGLPFILDSTIARRRDGIFLSGVNLEEGDLSLFSQPRVVIEQYYKGSKSTVQECKVIFLGDSEAGKSSLIERILHDTFEEGTLPTDGIQTSKWSTTIEGAPFCLRILDFGGQEIMHAMHRCFLSLHTVYVVVCASRNDSEIDRTATRWLENVKTFAPECPVILVLNKEDLNRHASVNERDLRHVNPFLRCVIKTSAKRNGDRGVLDLIKEIQETVPACVNKIEANADMLGVKQDLEMMERDYISYDEYLNICVKHNIMESSLQDGMLNWFKDLGVAYSYPTDLQEVQVLDPEWLTNGIYRLILHTPESGFLSHKIIRETLRSKNSRDSMPEKIYTVQETEFILHVMRTFEISHKMKNGIEIIPMKMTKTPSKEVDDFPKDDALHLRWKASFLPINLIHRLIIRKIDELDKNCVWRTGGIFRGYQCVAMAEMHETTLDLYVNGTQEQRQYMQEFRKEIQRILDELNIKAEEVICCKIDGQEGQIPYEDVMQQWLDGMKIIYIPGIKKYRSPAQLLHEIYPQIEKEKEDYIMNVFNLKDCIIGSVGDGNTIYSQKIDSIIQGADVPNDELLLSLRKKLEIYCKSESASEDEIEEVKKILEDTENEPPARFWEKVRPFLEDAEKLSKILPFLANSATAIMNFLTK